MSEMGTDEAKQRKQGEDKFHVNTLCCRSSGMECEKKHAMTFLLKNPATFADN